jgi:hypothetical protein
MLVAINIEMQPVEATHPKPIHPRMAQLQTSRKARSMLLSFFERTSSTGDELSHPVEYRDRQPPAANP